jgi:predicted O-methyltransferase YrrM
MRRLTTLGPQLAPLPAEWHELRDAIAPAYDRYVNEVSAPGYAASLEASTLLYHVCRVIRARSALDLGSGFTSYVLRRYAREAPYDVDVVSVDSDPDWLTKTADFLRENDCSAAGLVTWEHFQSLEPVQAHDVVFHDLHGDLREDATPLVIAHVAPSGVIMVDDTQRVTLRRRVLDEGFAAGFTFYDVRDWTVDSIGRWSLLGAR